MAEQFDVVLIEEEALAEVGGGIDVNGN